MYSHEVPPERDILPPDPSMYAHYGKEGTDWFGICIFSFVGVFVAFCLLAIVYALMNQPTQSSYPWVKAKVIQLHENAAGARLISDQYFYSATFLDSKGTRSSTIIEVSDVNDHSEYFPFSLFSIGDIVQIKEHENVACSVRFEGYSVNTGSCDEQ